MMISKSRKGISLGIEAIVIIVIALVTMVLIIGFVSGGFQNVGGSLADVGNTVKSSANDSSIGQGLNASKNIW